MKIHIVSGHNLAMALLMLSYLQQVVAGDAVVLTILTAMSIVSISLQFSTSKNYVEKLKQASRLLYLKSRFQVVGIVIRQISKKVELDITNMVTFKFTIASHVTDTLRLT
jgi:hypothetical protein